MCKYKFKCQFFDISDCKKLLTQHKCAKNEIINNRNLTDGPSFSGKTHLLKKKLDFILLGNSLIRSPEHNDDDFNTEQKIRDISDHEISINVSDDIIEYNQTELINFSQE